MGAGDIVEGLARQHALDIDAEKGVVAPAVAYRQEYLVALSVDAEVEMIRADNHRAPVFQVELVAGGQLLEAMAGGVSGEDTRVPITTGAPTSNQCTPLPSPGSFRPW